MATLNTPYNYDDPASTLLVVDGDLAVADDVNNVWGETDQKFTDISTDMEAVNDDATLAREWAEAAQGTNPDPTEPTEYSSKAYKEEAEEWAISDDGVINKADGTTETAKSSKTYAEEAEASAVIAQTASNFVGLWSSLTGALTVPSTVLHEDSYWILLTDIADVTLDEPGVTSNWEEAYSSISQLKKFGVL